MGLNPATLYLVFSLRSRRQDMSLGMQVRDTKMRLEATLQYCWNLALLSPIAYIVGIFSSNKPSVTNNFNKYATLSGVDVFDAH